MSNDANNTILIGRLVRDPELRYTPAGAAVASFTLANGYSYKKDGEKKETVSFFDCIAWSKLAEIIAEHVRKGQQLYIEGRLSQRRWSDQDGHPRSKVEIVVDKMQFLGGKKSDDKGSTPTGQPDNSMGTPADDVPPFDEHDSYDDEPPF